MKDARIWRINNQHILTAESEDTQAAICGGREREKESRGERIDLRSEAIRRNVEEEEEANKPELLSSTVRERFWRKFR